MAVGKLEVDKSTLFELPYFPLVSYIRLCANNQTDKLQLKQIKQRGSTLILNDILQHTIILLQ